MYSALNPLQSVPKLKNTKLTQTYKNKIWVQIFNTNLGWFVFYLQYYPKVTQKHKYVCRCLSVFSLLCYRVHNELADKNRPTDTRRMIPLFDHVGARVAYSRNCSQTDMMLNWPLPVR